MMKSSRRHQAGATLLEALAFLGIAAIIVVGAISMFRAAQGSAQANTIISEINVFRSTIKTLFASQGSYAINGTPDVFPATTTSGLWTILFQNTPGSLPSTIRRVGSSLKNQFGGVTGVRGDDSSFWIFYTQVPQEICLKVAPQIGGSWMGLQINGNAFVDTDTESFPVATADAQCTSGTSNTMIFRSR